jgi:hypothetical protein
LFIYYYFQTTSRSDSTTIHPDNQDRNLVIDLGKGVKTNAQLTLPAEGDGAFLSILLISGSGANDKNGTLGLVFSQCEYRFE